MSRGSQVLRTLPKRTKDFTAAGVDLKKETIQLQGSAELEEVKQEPGLDNEILVDGKQNAVVEDEDETPKPTPGANPLESVAIASEAKPQVEAIASPIEEQLPDKTIITKAAVVIKPAVEEAKATTRSSSKKMAIAWNQAPQLEKINELIGSVEIGRPVKLTKENHKFLSHLKNENYDEDLNITTFVNNLIYLYRFQHHPNYKSKE